MSFYPIFVELAGRSVLVVGGGAVAERRVQALLNHGAMVHVISPHLTPALLRLVSQGSVQATIRRYQSGDCRHAFLVFAATDDTQTNESVWRDARTEGVPANTADDPARCDFIVPAICSRGDLTVAVSTGGKSPALAARVRDVIERRLGSEYDRFIELLGDLRPEIRRRLSDSGTRKNVHYRILGSDVLDKLRAKDEAGARERIDEIIRDAEVFSR